MVRDGSEITFIRRSSASGLSLQGGLQAPMQRIAGTDLWTVTFRVPDADRAVISYSVIDPAMLRPGVRIEMMEWRGPAAPARAPKSTTLQGLLISDTLTSRALGGPREVVVYRPPERGGAPIDRVVYLGDGASVQGLASYVDTLIVTGALPRVMLVGIVTGRPGPGDPAGLDVRSMEYLWDSEPGNRRFLAHERFLLEEVMPWGESRHGAPGSRDRRAVWGISNSGGWAIQMGLRRPEVFSHVFAFSPGGSHGVIPDGARLTPPVRFYLHGGTLEPAFHAVALDWADTLRSRGVEHVFREAVAGHDWLVWAERFPEALRWAWLRRPLDR